MSTTVNPEAGIDDHEREQIQRANSSGRASVVFVHGLWLLHLDAPASGRADCRTQCARETRT
jgi:hypothetical protein